MEETLESLTTQEGKQINGPEPANQEEFTQKAPPLGQHEEKDVAECVGPEKSEEKGTANANANAIAVVNDDDDDDYDDYDEDDEEEKDNSHKLVIDIDDDEEDDAVKILEENADADADDVPLDKDKLAIVKDILNQTSAGKTQSSSLQVDENDAIIILSDAEEETPKPGKIQKRKSTGEPQDEKNFRLKRRKINAAGAPKMPLTGYVRYMNDRRESARKENPNKTSVEIQKQIGEEWQTLAVNIKTDYLMAAEKDKQRYTSELHSFLKSRPDILASELAKNKNKKNENVTGPSINITKTPVKDKPQPVENHKPPKDVIKEKITTKECIPVPVSNHHTPEKQAIYEKPKRKRTPTPPSTSAYSSASAPSAAPAHFSSSTAAPQVASASIITPTPGEIPIFTNEFLEHNKLYDMELRALRKSKTDLEQQNFVLEKHVENMKCGVDKMSLENKEIEEKNRLLEIYLDKLKQKLTHAFASLPLPNAPNGATMENVDKYMQDLYKMSSSNSHGPATLNKAKDIIRKLDLQIQL